MQELSSILLGVALLASAALVAWGLALMFRPQSEAQETSEQTASWEIASGLLLVTGIAVVAFAIRAVDIEHRGMTHVEVYVPGIELPDDISTPQPRIGIGETLKWHYFREPHPPAYYIMGWAWTRVAGTELWVLRLPSVLLGAASIFLVYALGVRTGGRAVGLLAALLLAFHGQHILYSQFARMYVPGTFLALLSALLWMRLLEEKTPRWKLELAYVGVTTLGLYTQTLLWLALAAQMLYTSGVHSRQEGPPRLLGLQLGCLILGAPIVSQAILLSRPSPFDIGPLAFLIDYLDFGFLFPPNLHPIDTWSDIPWALEGAFTALAIALLALGLRLRPAHAPEARPSDRAVSGRALAMMGLGIAGLLLAMSGNHRVWRRNELFAASALLPLLALAAGLLLPRLQAAFDVLRRLLDWLREKLPGLATPVAFVALVPITLILLVYPLFSLLVARGLLFSVPFLLVLIAHGLVGRGEVAAWRKALIATVVAIHLGGAAYAREFTSGTGYRELAEKIATELEPGDLIFVNYRDWGTTPIFYHLSDHTDRLVATDYAAAAASPETKRVWQVRLGVPPSEEMEEALCGFREERRIEEQNIWVILRVPDAEAARDCDSESPQR